ncbi:MAG: hypothetical protein AAF581_11100 [Planctomycetota bacterium]
MSERLTAEENRIEPQPVIDSTTAKGKLTLLGCYALDGCERKQLAQEVLDEIGFLSEQCRRKDAHNRKWYAYCHDKKELPETTLTAGYMREVERLCKERDEWKQKFDKAFSDLEEAWAELGGAK